MRPFSTYPEDREKLLALAKLAERSDDANAIELGDLVRAILEDEAVAISATLKLNEQLEQLCADHDLSSINVGVMRLRDRWCANVSAHGGGECATAGIPGETLADALRRCLIDLHARRMHLAAVPELVSA